MFKTFSAGRHTRQYKFWIKCDASATYESTVAVLSHLIELNSTRQKCDVWTGPKTTATSIDFACITQGTQHVDTNTKLGCVLPTLRRNIHIHCQFLILLRQALLRLFGLRDIRLQWTGYGIFGNSKRDIPRYRTSDTFIGEKAAALWKKYSRTSGWDHLSSETSFPKYRKFPGQITRDL